MVRLSFHNLYPSENWPQMSGGRLLAGLRHTRRSGPLADGISCAWARPIVLWPCASDSAAERFPPPS